MRLGKKKEDTAVGIDMKDWSSIIVRRLCYSKTAMTSIRNPKVTSRERLDTPQAVPNSSDPTPTEKKNFDDANDRRLDISTAQENVKISNFQFSTILQLLYCQFSPTTRKPRLHPSTLSNFHRIRCHHNNLATTGRQNPTTSQQFLPTKTILEINTALTGRQSRQHQRRSKQVRDKQS